VAWHAVKLFSTVLITISPMVFAFTALIDIDYLVRLS
jgi:hypothetical protein